MQIDRFLCALKRTISEAVIAYLLAFIATGGDTLLIAKVVLAIKLNVFALPLASTPALTMPLWVWYVISVIWLQQWLNFSPYSLRDAAVQVEELVSRTDRKALLTADRLVADGSGENND